MVIELFNKFIVISTRVVIISFINLEDFLRFWKKWYLKKSIHVKPIQLNRYTWKKRMTSEDEWKVVVFFDFVESM